MPVVARRVFVAAPVTLVTAAGGVPPACVVGGAGADTSAAAAETVAVAAEPVALVAVGGAEGVAASGAEGTAAGEPAGGAEDAAPEEDDPPGSVAVTGAVAEPSAAVTVPTTDPTGPVGPVAASAEAELPEA
jgi:hypothetical protein